MTATDPWARLSAELALWAAGGRAATLWWRDDDAVAATPALERLLDLAAGRPLTLAVIPEPATGSLAARLADASKVGVAQHGWAHRNHRPPGARAAELGLDRPLAQVVAELSAGRARLADLFGAAPAMLVPPWNRIDPAVAAILPDLGYGCLSTFGPRAVGDRFRVNAHVDPIGWKAGRAFIGATKILDRLTGHLEARRTGAADVDEPTGLLTHHLAHDEDLWRFLADLTAFLDRQPGVRWVTPPVSP